MVYFYIVASAVITLLLDIPFDIFKNPNGWFIVPLILLGVFVAFVLLHCAVFALCIQTVSLKKPPRDTAFFRGLVKSFLHLAFKLAGITVHTTGLEKVPLNERFLLVCNHIHEIDPAVILHELPDEKLAFVAKKEVSDLFPFVFKALYKMNGLPIDRENNREAAKTIINATKLIKEDKNSVAIFPEGYVSLSGELLPIRNGALKIATKTQSKIVVCTLVGTKEIVKNMFRRRHDVYFDIIEVIDTKDNTHTAELGDMVHSLMLEAINSRKTQSL